MNIQGSVWNHIVHEGLQTSTFNQSIQENTIVEYVGHQNGIPVREALSLQLV